MRKSTRSVSLPDRAVNQLVNTPDRSREVKTVLKNDGKRSLEKENEIEVKSKDCERLFDINFRSFMVAAVSVFELTKSPSSRDWS